MRTLLALATPVLFLVGCGQMTTQRPVAEGPSSTQEVHVAAMSGIVGVSPDGLTLHLTAPVGAPCSNRLGAATGVVREDATEVVVVLSVSGLPNAPSPRQPCPAALPVQAVRVRLVIVRMPLQERRRRTGSMAIRGLICAGSRSRPGNTRARTGRRRSATTAASPTSGRPAPRGRQGHAASGCSKPIRNSGTCANTYPPCHQGMLRTGPSPAAAAHASRRWCRALARWSGRRDPRAGATDPGSTVPISEAR